MKIKSMKWLLIVVERFPSADHRIMAIDRAEKEKVVQFPLSSMIDELKKMH